MSCIAVPQILLPKKGTDLQKWAVVACDQYTSQPEYWAQTSENVGAAPSTLKLILPEVYLGAEDEAEKTAAIRSTMERYLTDGTLEALPRGFILVERHTGGETARKGLVVCVDLEAYSYQEGDRSLIRPTEKTVVERIPPRLAVRRGAPVELPHIMILIDDPQRTVIEPLFNEKLKMVYDTDLQQQGGHIRGWFVPEGALTEQVAGCVDALLDRKAFNAKYQLEKDLPMLNCAVGDGNHSLATAKAYWDEVKTGLSAQEQENHPARFCLCELVNIHDESLLIEPIHRVLFQADAQLVLEEAKAFFEAHGCGCEISAQPMAADVHTQVIPYCCEAGEGYLVIHNPAWGIALGSLQAFLDDFLAKHGDARLDYIHGEEVTRRLGCQEGNMGFILPPIEKGDLFRGVIIDGVLPRKTFSMGHAWEKRYYMEAKRITL